MIARLPHELQQEVARQGDHPIQVVDPETQKMYVLVPADLFERLKSFADDRFDIREMYAAQDAALNQVWSDPELDEYADYDRHKAQS